MFKEMSDNEEQKENELSFSQLEQCGRRKYKVMTNVRDNYGKRQVTKELDCMVPILLEYIYMYNIKRKYGLSK